MNKRRCASGMGNLVALTLVFVCGIVTTPLQAVEKTLCELTFSDCPQDHDGELLQVPSNVISLHAALKHCPPEISFSVRLETPPAIMFVIDHSGSMEMTTEEGGGNDLEEARFSVVSQLLDEIYEMNPKTQVGVVAFANRLAFDWRDNEIFTRMVSVRPVDHDSYLPLRPLDDPTWDISVIKEVLRIDQSTPIGADPFFTKRLIFGTERLMTRTPSSGSWPQNSIRYGTDITLGLTAALEAFRNSATPKDRRFIVFLSDGEATAVDEERKAYQSLYTDTNFLANFPTTFTIWFGENAHPSLVDMTEKIKTNDYSASNPRSGLWSIQTPHDELLQLLASIVEEQIFSTVSNPATATVEDVMAATMTDSTFNFTKPFPLGTQSDTVDMQFRYAVVDTVTGSQADTVDTIITSSIYVDRRDDATLPDWADTVCYNRVLQLHNNGVEIGQITPATTDLEVFFRTTYSSQELFDSSYISEGSVTITALVTNDSYTAGMRNEGDYFLRPFAHALNATANPNDATIQHREIDSLRIVWRNAYHPLDTIMLVVPVRYNQVERPYTNRPNTQVYPSSMLDTVVDTVYMGSVTGITLSTTTPGATIWYTLDGTMPQQDNVAHRYDAGETIDITQPDVLLTAFATKPAHSDSKLLRVRYIRTYDRIPPQAAFYEDLDGDGIVDAFTLVVNQADVARMDLDKIAMHPELISLGDVESGAFRIDSIRQGPGANEIRISVTPASPKRISGRTITVTITENADLKEDGYLKGGTLQATDRIPPVLIDAVYIVQKSDWTGKADTLRVRMSEVFEFTDSARDGDGLMRPFSLWWTAENTPYQLDLEPVGYDATKRWYTFIVRGRGAGARFPAENDSIWVTAGKIRDLATPANVQDGTNRKVRLRVEYPPVTMNAEFLTNPVGPTPMNYAALMGINVKPGTIALLQVKPTHFTDSAFTAKKVNTIEVTMYDPVGNVVKSELDIFNARGNYYAGWDGTNKAGRKVGTGTYLTVVHILYRDGSSEVQNILLGVKR